MTSAPSNASAKIPPKWVVFAFLIGAVCSFVAAALAFTFNGIAASVFALVALTLYVAGGIGFARAPRRAVPQGPETKSE